MATTDSEELALMAMTSMAIFGDTLVLFLVFLTFRRHTGLYFWTLIGTAMSQILVCISTYLSFWVLGSRLIGIPLALSNIGNSMYVVFQFLVLYSRLHIIGASRRHLRLILGTIITEFCVAELPLVVLSVYSTLHPENISAANIYRKYWDVEAVLYTLVDCALSAMYFILIRRMWGEERAWVRVHWNIVGMIALILCIDATYLLFVFSDASEILLGLAVRGSIFFRLFWRANAQIAIDFLPQSSH
jgi:hypothetical protein